MAGKSGRHFAEDVYNGIHEGLDHTATIEAAITRWMGWIINREPSHEIVLPNDLVYLNSVFLTFSLQAQAA